MKFKIKTKLIDGKCHITECKSVLPKNIKEGDVIISSPVHNLVSEEGLYQYVIENKEVIKEPQEKNENFKKKEYNRRVINKITEKYSRNDEIKLLNGAVSALIDGAALPEEYIQYRKYVKESKDVLAGE